MFKLQKDESNVMNRNMEKVWKLWVVWEKQKSGSRPILCIMLEKEKKPEQTCSIVKSVTYSTSWRDISFVSYFIGDFFSRCKAFDCFVLCALLCSVFSRSLVDLYPGFWDWMNGWIQLEWPCCSVPVCRLRSICHLANDGQINSTHPELLILLFLCPFFSIEINTEAAAGGHQPYIHHAVVRVLFHYMQYTDKTTSWVIHCHGSITNRVCFCWCFCWHSSPITHAGYIIKQGCFANCYR